ncbi:metallophosphoesterase [Bdellovibrio sp. HCB337]|uniref:metallophosphoesterase n=1 Tax=Bdellovibrio sp. HCB337 TaxID=3394358 RepID=UPI0039A7723A
MGIFRAVIFILVAAMFFYISQQLTRFADFPLWATMSIIGFLAILFLMVLSLPLFFWMKSSREHKAWHDTFFFFTHMAIAYINFLIVFVVLRDILGFAGQFMESPSLNDTLYGATGSLTTLLLPVLFIAVGTLVVRRGPRRIEVPIKFDNLPKDLEGLRILHITDLHISRSLPTRFIHQLIKVAEEKPVDMVVYTGDILDDIPSRYVSDLELLKKITSKYGSFFVPGNHEYYWDGTKSVPAFSKIGFNVLVNDSRTLKIGQADLQIWGVPDPAAKMFQLEGPDFKKIEQEMNPEAFKILLSHQPSLADIAAPLGIELQLSGHTHGGQFFPWNMLIGFFEKYGKGLYKIQNLQLYVNQGTGYWGPSLRLGTYCEVAEIVLQSK